MFRRIQASDDDVTEFDRLHLPVQTRRLIHPYSDAADCNAEVRVVKLEEALADKLSCLIQRRYSFDLAACRRRRRFLRRALP